MQPTAKFCSECGTPLQVKEKLLPGKRRNGAKSLGRAPRAKSRPTLARPSAAAPEAERRQLTVMFCDLVGSTALSAQLDPEELREVVRLYQETCTAVIQRYAGYIAQHLGDGVLVYFGYPVAHEDEAARAIRAGLEIIAALRDSPLQRRQLPSPLQVRIGIHTGVVVIGEIGSSAKREILALGETPNIAARVQGVTAPDTVAVSAVTQHLVQGLFECQGLGPQILKGIATPLLVYCVISESGAQSRFEVAIGAGLTPLVGREEELGLLQRRWAQAKEGAGQVVLLSGEPGIGKSRLVQTLKEKTVTEGATRIEFRCSPYHQNSAFYPIIDHLHRLLLFEREDAPQAKLTKLQQRLARYRFPEADTLPLFATLLSLPQPAGTPPLTLSPQKRKQKTQGALVAWIIEEAQKTAVYCAWEDLHWVDPSTLEVLTLLLEQIPTTRMFALLTFRPEFTPPWGNRSHLSQLTLSRLGRSQVEAMVEKVTSGKALPSEVLQQIVTKTDGVPLFVEELTKMVLESGLVRAEENRYVGAHGGVAIPPLAIPSTLQDSLMARLDRLAPVKEIAQLGATLGREFSYEMLHAVSPVDEGSLQQGLRQLVEAELIYQRGLPPHAVYIFKHALIQDTAYQSLLKSKRQQYHSQIAQRLEEQFPDTKEMQPELLAHHYTEAGLIGQAIPYWQLAGERASQRSAYVEAVAHLTKGLELLQSLPETPERGQQELTLLLALNGAQTTIKGYTAPEVEHTVRRAQALCQQLGDTPQRFPAQYRLWGFYYLSGEVRTARELAEPLLPLAQKAHDPDFLVWAHVALGWTSYQLGELSVARAHSEEAIALYNPQQHLHSIVSPADPKVQCLTYGTWTLWLLGYPAQALTRSQEALAVAAGLANSFSRAYALGSAATVHALRREGSLARARAEELMTLATEQGFPWWLAWGTWVQGSALVEQGHVHEGIARIRQTRDMFTLASLAGAYGKLGQVEEGLAVLTTALARADKTGNRVYEAELYRLKGELALQQSSDQSRAVEAETCFLKAIDIALPQHAKSLELRATTSLARLWQEQGKQKAAHQLLSEVYHWFTEGFDTKDLQEAKMLLAELAEER
jgi:predicted ATPase/class 3 adenylate cyclase